MELPQQAADVHHTASDDQDCEPKSSTAEQQATIELDDIAQITPQSKKEAVPEIREGPATAKDNESVENVNRPKGARFALLFISILLGSFFMGYVCIHTLGKDSRTDSHPFKDSSCIVTLTPVITDDFHALTDIGWYSIA
jgi:hypothetical protein